MKINLFFIHISRFSLQTKAGGLIRVHTSALQPTSQYKSLLISEQTTSDELLGLLLSSYNSVEPVEQFSLYEVCPDQEYQRKLHPDDLPLLTQLQRNQKGENCHFLVRRNPNFSRRLLMALNEQASKNHRYSLALPSPTEIIPTFAETAPCTPSDSSILTKDLNNNVSSLVKSASFDACCKSLFTPKDKKPEPSIISSFQALSLSRRNSMAAKRPTELNLHAPALPAKPKLPMSPLPASPSSSSYSPVYNIREIRTGCHSFSSLGNDKKLLDIESNSVNKRHSVVIEEATNTNPSLGIGNFVYI